MSLVHGRAGQLLGAVLPDRRRAEVIRDRMALVVSTLGPTPSPDARILRDQFAELLGSASPDRVWLAMAVLDGELPTSAAVQRTVRAIRLDGPRSAFAKHLTWRAWLTQPAGGAVEVLTRGILVDVEHTARTRLATGIQRVTREIARRWHGRTGVVLVGWTQDGRAMYRLTPEEQQRALTGAGPEGPPAPSPLVVPWESTYVLPELALEPERTTRMAAMARFGRLRSAIVGHDCVPVTTAETVGVGVSGTFIGYLAAVRNMDRVATVSQASATEYLGWRHMLGAVGLKGPEVRAVPLPAETGSAAPAAVERARERFVPDGLPMVLCVGTHEPRKNHVAILHAAELLWRRGVQFSLTFIGGDGWGFQSFRSRLDELRQAGRPVQSVSGVPDDELWAAYGLARCMVFPSLNEGFGLPVAEALACGTPVITSAFGSMQEIASGGGALLLDPRDDRALAAAMERILTDDALHGRLRTEALRRPGRAWDDYADELWGFLVPDAP